MLRRNVNISMVSYVSVYVGYVVHVIDDRALSLMYYFALC